MQTFPHQYEVTVRAENEGDTELTSRGLTPLLSAPPAEFNGPGDRWSPETLTVAAVANCFVLTFKAIARASKLKFANIVCNAKGTLDRADGVIRFTAIHLQVRLELPPEGDPDRAHRLLEKAEKGCLVGNSLRFQPTMQAEIVVEQVPCLLGR